MVYYSTNHSQVVGRRFAHPLSFCKSANPLNSLSRLESQYNGPNLGLLHSKSNRSYIKNLTDALQVQTDLDYFDSRNDSATNAISSPQIKCLHRNRENRLRHRHHGQPTHPVEKTLKPEMLELGEIDISPWNYFPLSKLLLVPLVVLNET